ncbi:MAG TPA: TldD/PmbA family protein [Caldisericia bacterium]|nr:TldD/PmbA family protein [Caldisericia bacterium]HPF49622.1 TldD/PmbA family protein [Caldisericia bacterium]HPI82959.1 TldD/PmbA family protein [Caldisericia bacterium]HPQ92186.1 TldD/PmbA family protein [Caldisericia bacterium]HRV74716.1 TldD/PmbA family protein [Caldisericia bacterium]
MTLTEIAKKALNVASGDQVEVVVSKTEQALTRFANSYIHQNVKQTDGNVRIRVIRDGKVGVAVTNSFDEDAVANCAKKACELSDLAVKDTVDFKLPSKSEYRSIPKYDEDTAKLNPTDRANAVKKMIDVAKPDSLVVAGAVSNELHTFAVLNSNGVEYEMSGANAQMKVTAMSDDSSGQADMAMPRFADIDPVTLAKDACGRALMGRKPIEIKPDEYEVVLLPYAVAELVRYSAYTGIPAQSANEGRSWLQVNMGKQVYSDLITLIDDPFNPLLVQMPADFEGYPKQPLTIVENGIAKSLVFDSYYSAKMSKPNTGHATTGWGAFPMHLTMKPGTKTVDEMISNVKKGILVSRFWYTNIMNPMKVQFTTMTRDGLFLIEDGKITNGLKNMRVTDDVLRIFSGAISLGNKVRNTDGIVVPAMHCKGLIFSGNTK